MKSHFKNLRSKSQLWKAWQVIRSNGIASRSLQTQKEIRQFDLIAPTEINRISGQLSSKRPFRFLPATGITQKKKNGGARPIVISPIRNRIVQRSILDTIQEDPKLQDLFDSATSYGGLKDKGVKDAVLRAYEEVRSGRAKFFITSDISGFFRDIKRQIVLEAINNRIADPQFQSLFRDALTTELENMAELRNEGTDQLFPIQEIGVAQGCCLSPLVGNVFLREFDSTMNETDVLCLRYIDDFIILGESEKLVRQKFNSALKILRALGLSAYKPTASSDKAKAGPTDKGFDYLGCTITPSVIRPSWKSWNRMHQEIKDSFTLTMQAVDASPKDFFKNRLSFADAVLLNRRRVESWIKQYRFCDDKRVIAQWNNVLQTEFHDFEMNFLKLIRSKSADERARLLGWVGPGFFWGNQT